MSLIIKGMDMPKKFKKGYNKYDNPRHYKDYKSPTIIEAEVSE